jgi:hypothetical protein
MNPFGWLYRLARQPSTQKNTSGIDLSSVKVRQRPEHIHELAVSEEIVAATLRHLQATGRRSCEEAALWGGHFSTDGVGVVTTLYLPDTVVAQGMVKIENPKVLAALIDEVDERSEFLLAQVHSHPGEAFHSDLDDDGAICGDLGFLSFVVQDYARDLPPVEDWAMFELTNGGWCDVSGDVLAVKVRPMVTRVSRRETSWTS